MKSMREPWRDNVYTHVRNPMCREDRAPRLGMCAFLNASVCHPTVEMSALGHTMVAALYNPLAWPRSEGIRVPLNTSSSKSWTVRGV